MSKKKLCLLSIKAKNENGIRVITIDYTFQVLNKTKEDIEISVMSLFDFPEKKMDKFSCSVTIPVDEGMEKPVPLPHFEIVGQMTGDQILFDGFQTFSFKIGDSEWSQPLNLGECRNATKDERNVVSIPLRNIDHDKHSNRLLVITNHQRNGQVFLILQDNLHAQFIIHNELPIKLWFLMANIKGMYIPSCCFFLISLRSIINLAHFSI